MDRVNIKIDTAKMPYTSSIFNKSQLITNGNETKQTENESLSCQVDISANGKRRAENANDYKKSGVTSAREVWEDSTKELKKTSRLTGPYADTAEIMRLDEPETYSQYMELNKKAMDNTTITETGKVVMSEEGKKYELESNKIICNWIDRRITGRHGKLGKSFSNTIEKLEEQFSDNIHETSFNVYGGNNPIAEDIWRFNSKFNVMISKKMFDALVNKSDDYDRVMSCIDDSVQNMKQAELNYEGNLDWLRFGVKFNDDLQATYYANFTGCKEKGGIQANSADELLQMLTNYSLE